MTDNKILLVVIIVFILIIWSESITKNKQIDNAYQEGYTAGYSAAAEAYGVYDEN